MADYVAYLRVEGVDPEELGEPFRDLAHDVFGDLSENHDDVSGVIPVFSPQYDPRLLEDNEVALDRETADVLLDAAGSLRDDIASGRTYGFDDAAHRENVDELENAYEALQNQLREEPDAVEEADSE
jgi:hypothetical protein